MCPDGIQPLNHSGHSFCPKSQDLKDSYRPEENVRMRRHEPAKLIPQEDRLFVCLAKLANPDRMPYLIEIRHRHLTGFLGAFDQRALHFGRVVD